MLTSSLERQEQPGPEPPPELLPGPEQVQPPEPLQQAPQPELRREPEQSQERRRVRAPFLRPGREPPPVPEQRAPWLGRTRRASSICRS